MSGKWSGAVPDRQPKSGKDMLKVADEFLTQYGWVKGHWYDERTGSYCLVGALNQIDGPHERQAAKRLARYIVKNGKTAEIGQRLVWENWYGAEEYESIIMDWNDSSAKDFDEVRAFLNGAAK